MSNPTGNKLEKLVFGMFDQMVEGADKYVTKQGSTWLIFTEDKRWVIEFTKDKTLWFNYNLFQSEFELISKDCTEERDLIKKWFESRFLNIPKVQDTIWSTHKTLRPVEDTIQDGVKDTSVKLYPLHHEVDDAIQNGVKETIVGDGNVTCYGEDAIQNGVKATYDLNASELRSVEDAIQNGVKETKLKSGNQTGKVDDTIQNGVKDAFIFDDARSLEIEHTIQHGVKHTEKSLQIDGSCVIEDTIQNGVKEILRGYSEIRGVKDTIQNGVKQTKIHGRPMEREIEDTIQNGVKEIKADRLIRSIHVMSAIINGVKHVEDGDWLDQDERIDNIIENGVKGAKLMSQKMSQKIDGVKEIGHKKTPDESFTNHIIEEGVKEIKEVSNFNLMSEIFKVNAKKAIIDGVKELKELPDKSGELRGYGDWYQRQGNMAKPHTEYVKEVIEDHYNHMGRVEGVIRNTDKDGI